MRLPAELLKRVERWCKRKGVVKRSDGMRMLLVAALDADEPPKAPPPLSKQLLVFLNAYRDEVGAATVQEAVEQLIKRAESTFEDKPAKKRGGRTLRSWIF